MGWSPRAAPTRGDETNRGWLPAVSAVLPRPEARFSRAATHVESCCAVLSDAGSTPAASTTRVHSHLSPCLGRDPGAQATPERPGTSWQRSTGARPRDAPAPAQSSRAAGGAASPTARCAAPGPRGAPKRASPIHASVGTRKTDSRDRSSAWTSTPSPSAKDSVSSSVLARARLGSALPQAMKSTIRVTRRRASSSCATFRASEAPAPGQQRG